MTSYYLFKVVPYNIISGKLYNTIFDAYLSVNNETNILTGIYDLSLPTTNGYTNVLLAPDTGSINIYSSINTRFKFYSKALETYFGINENFYVKRRDSNGSLYLSKLSYVLYLLNHKYY